MATCMIFNFTVNVKSADDPISKSDPNRSQAQKGRFLNRVTEWLESYLKIHISVLFTLYSNKYPISN
jgi:hypothetical protein